MTTAAGPKTHHCFWPASCRTCAGTQCDGANLLAGLSHSAGPPPHLGPCSLSPKSQSPDGGGQAGIKLRGGVVFSFSTCHAMHSGYVRLKPDQSPTPAGVCARYPVWTFQLLPPGAFKFPQYPFGLVCPSFQREQGVRHNGQGPEVLAAFPRRIPVDRDKLLRPGRLKPGRLTAISHRYGVAVH